MKMKLGVLLVLSIAGLAAAVSVARPRLDRRHAQAHVGPGYSISLTRTAPKLTHLDPGTYTINVNDQADIHNFDLFGPGVKESTGVDTTGIDHLDGDVRRRDVQLRLRRPPGVDEGHRSRSAPSRRPPPRRRLRRRPSR